MTRSRAGYKVGKVYEELTGKKLPGIVDVERGGARMHAQAHGRA